MIDHFSLRYVFGKSYLFKINYKLNFICNLMFIWPVFWRKLNSKNSLYYLIIKVDEKTNKSCMTFSIKI